MLLITQERFRFYQQQQKYIIKEMISTQITRYSILLDIPGFP